MLSRGKWGTSFNENKISHRWRGCALLDSQLSSKDSQPSLVQEPAVGCIAWLDVFELYETGKLHIINPHPAEAEGNFDKLPLHIAWIWSRLCFWPWNNAARSRSILKSASHMYEASVWDALNRASTQRRVVQICKDCLLLGFARLREVATVTTKAEVSAKRDLLTIESLRMADDLAKRNFDWF